MAASARACDAWIKTYPSFRPRALQRCSAGVHFFFDGSLNKCMKNQNGKVRMRKEIKADKRCKSEVKK